MAEAKLFIGNLPSDVTTEELSYVFGSYGTVAKLHLMDATRSKSGHACAFVVYTTPEAAATAIRTLDGVYKIRENAPEPISVSVARGHSIAPGEAGPAAAASTLLMPGVPGVSPVQPATMGAMGTMAGAPTMPMTTTIPAQPSLDPLAAMQPTMTFAPQQPTMAPQAPAQLAAPVLGAPPMGGGFPGAPPTKSMCKLFVGDLPSDITKEAILFVFSNYGNVTDVHVMTGKSRSGAACAIVEYSNEVEAQTAIATLHQKYEIRAGAGPISVRVFEGGRGKGAPPPGGVLSAPRFSPY